jgi:hypothetical protein
MLMGVYLAVIGVADQVFLGSYLWRDVQWKQSAMCQVAGFVSLLSNEMSAFVVRLITLDRFLVLRFPFSARHFGRRSATLACLVTWLVRVALAVVPLLPFTSHWHFYGQTGICIPFPISRKQFAGQGYSFGILIVANFVLFLLIAVGQVSVFASIRANSMTSSNVQRNVVNNNSTTINNKSRELAIARRLAVIVVSDFLCWFPIGVLGLLAAWGDVPIPGEAGVAVAIFVLPLNSALNPFLYTVSVVLAKRAQRQRDDLMRVLEARLRGQNATAGLNVAGERNHSADTIKTAHDLHHP